MNKLMKGILLAMISVLLFSPTAFASPETVILGLTADGSGTTTMPTSESGVSPFFVVHSPRGSDVGETRISGLIFQKGNFTLQIDSMTYPDTVTSGATFTIRYKESEIDDTAHWDAAQTFTIIDEMALSGNTLYKVPFYPNFGNYLKFELVSGASPFNTVKIRVNHN